MLEQFKDAANREYIQSLIDRGVCDSEPEALEAVVTRLRAEEEKQRRKVQALIQEGVDSLERGEGIPLDDQTLGAIYREGIEDWKNGTPIPDHVKP